MGKRQFLVEAEWCYDHTNKEIFTFVIEGDEKEEGDKTSPIFIGKPLDATNFPIYFKKHDGVIERCIEKMCEAIDNVNGNPMGGKTLPTIMFEIINGGYGYLKEFNTKPVNLEVGPCLCTFKPNTGKMVLARKK